MQSNQKTRLSVSSKTATVLLAASVGVIAPAAKAADIVYSLIPTDANFSGINWALGQDPTAAPTQAAGLTDALYFGGAPTISSVPVTALTNDLTAAAFTGITFNSDAAAFTIGGNAFNLGGDITNNSANTQTISPAITVDTARTLNAAFTSSVAFSPGTIVLTGNVGGTGGFIKNGSGTATLAGANNYTGGTTVNAGSLVAKRTTQVALGTGAVTVASGANVTIQDHAGGSQAAYANAFNLTGTGINGTGALRFLNSGGFAVTGPVSISGGTTIATDPVTQSTTSLINFSTAAIISGSGGLNLVSQGSAAAGTPQIRLDAANIYTGDTRLTSSGVNTTPFTVTLQGTSANRLPVTTNLIFGGTPTGATGTFDKSVTLALNNTAQTVAGLSTDNTPAAGQAYRIVGVNANTAVFSVANATANTYNGSFGGAGTNNNNIQLNKTGAGLLTLGGDSSHAGTGATLANGKVAGYGTVIGVVTTAGVATADVTTGSVRATSNNAFGGAGILLASTSTAPISGVQLQGGISLPAVNTLTMTTGRSVSLSTASASPVLRNISGDNTFAGAINILTGGGGVYIQSDANTLTLSGNLGSGNAASIYGFSGAGNINVTGNITTTTAGQITKLGGGLLTLSGTNTYTGNTTIGNTLADGAAIRATSSGALGTGTVVINAGTASGLTPSLQLAGGITLPNAITATLRNINNSSPEILNVSGDNTLQGNITSAAPSGGNGYNIQSDSGTLTLNGNLSFANAAIYVFQGAGNTTVNGSLSSATGGGVNKTGSGTLTLNGSNSYTGATTVTGGTLRATSPASTNFLTNAGGLAVNGLTSNVVLDYTGGTSPVTTVRTLLLAGFNDAATPGVVDSGQIRSTSATAKIGVGYADNGTGVIRLKATLFGDADLDGGVSINDFNALAGNFGQASGRVWEQGDFDYDGGVSINDFNLLAGNFGQTLPASSEAWAGLLAFAAAHNDLEAFAAITGVPEPTSLGLIAAGATLGLRRRRRSV